MEELERSNAHSDPDSGWGSVLRPRHLKPLLRVPHQSLSRRRLGIWGHAGVSGWYLRLLSDRVGEWVSKRVG